MIDNPIWPGPRLLVPMFADAMLIGVNNQFGNWAAVRVEYDRLPLGNPIPGPFGTAAAPPGIGVHLQWTLPSAMRQGAAGSNGETTFPNLPDRWVITRTRITGDTSGQFANLTVWVLQSDFKGSFGEGTVAYPFNPDTGANPEDNYVIKYIGKRFDLPNWSGAAPADPPFLTAFSPGDVSFTNVYSNVPNVLSFYDDLSSEPTGKYAYSIAGWYANPEVDPLFGKTPETPNGFTDRQEWEALMASLQWSVGGEAEIDRAIADWERWLEQNPISGGPTIPEIMKTLPGQSLCHSMIFDIEWRGPNVVYPIAPILQNPQPPVVAIGNTATEAIAAWMAKETQNPAAEPTLIAFQMGRIFDYLKDPEDFAAEVQATSFGPSRSSRQWVVTRPAQENGEPPAGGADIPLDSSQTQLLIDLNDSQMQFDKASFVLESLRQELFADGWKQAFVSPRDRNLQAQINAAVDALIIQIDTQKTQVDQLFAQVEETRIALVAAVEPEFVVSFIDQIRLNQPEDPVIMVAGAALDTKLETPGTPGVADLLFTRFTGQTIDGLQVTFPINGVDQTTIITPSQIQEHVVLPSNAFIPKEMGSYWIETLYLNTDAAPLFADLFFGVFQYKPHTEERDALIKKIQKQQTLVWNDTPLIDKQTIAELAGLQGTIPEKISVSAHTPPWTPLFLDWEVVWHPTSATPAGQLEGWELDDFDFKWDGTIGAPLPSYSVRVMLNSASANNISSNLDEFLATSPNLDQLPIFIVDLLREMSTELKHFDVLTQGIGGFTEGLMQLLIEPSVNYPNQNQQIPSIVAGASTFLPLPGTVTTPRPFVPIRAGHATIQNLRIVDAFGQVLPAMPNQVGPLLPIRSRSVFTEGDGNQAFVQLPPRLSQSARLDFRLIDATDDTIRSNSSDRTSPIAGWLVPNHLDDGLMIFDKDGNNLGEVLPIQRDEGTGLRWEPVPGTNEPLGAPPNIANDHLRGFVNGLLLRGATGSEALRELLDAIDTSLFSSWPVSQPLPGNLDVLIGAPIAVVRTATTFQVGGLPVVNQAWNLTGLNQTDGWENVPFPVRIGDLGLHTNGCLGYFLDNNYATFFSSFGYTPTTQSLRRVLQQSSSDNRAELLKQLRSAVQKMGDSRAATTGYISPNHLFHLKPDNRDTRFQTVLLDPSGWIPAITGMQPINYLSLASGPVTQALQNMEATFRTGPLLLPPDRIQMPLPADIRGDWSWIERTGVTVWRQDNQIADNNPTALLPETLPVLREGWLKLKGALGRNDE